MLWLAFAGIGTPALSKEYLPHSLTFKGARKYNSIMDKARRGQWHKMPMSTRMVRFAKEMHGTPYKGFTLEVHDKIESPSANFEGLDCWTFFEITLGLSRMIENGNYEPSASRLLRAIEFTRYRGGICDAGYLDRIHYLAEWFFENEARGVAQDITRELGGAVRLRGRDVSEMTKLWKSYRYLRNNPSLLPGMAKQEKRVEGLPVYYIPRSRVRSIESKLQNGDIVGTVTKYDGGYCSHVGIVYVDSKGARRFMHASTTYDRVVIDKTVSGYLNSISKYLGAIIARPLPVSKTVRTPAQYEANLKKLLRGANGV